MALAIVHSRALVGSSAPAVTVEVHLANGLPNFQIVGLPDAEVRESRERVRAALQESGFQFPTRRITVNLAPADLPKRSSRLDLPIALGILVASDQLPAGQLDRLECVGELSLSGTLRASGRGVLGIALANRRDPAGRTLLLPLLGDRPVFGSGRRPRRRALLRTLSLLHRFNTATPPLKDRNLPTPRVMTLMTLRVNGYLEHRPHTCLLILIQSILHQKRPLPLPLWLMTRHH
jgi:hypothetical protein